MTQADEATVRRNVVLVTGLSGAGRTTCLKTLEDRGYEAVDNLPLSLLSALLPAAEPASAPAPSTATREAGATAPSGAIAVGVDFRTRDFASALLLDRIAALRNRGDLAVRTVFLDCDDDVLIRRFTETRRRHPLATDRPVADGIAAERRLLAPIRDIADVVIDSSHLSIAAFRRLLSGALGLEAATGLAVSVVSFGFRYGLPREADMVFDVRFLANPHYDAVLRPHDGRQPEVAAFVAADPDWPDFFERLTGLVGPLLPRFAEEGKSYLTLAIGCTGGRHRSVFAAERLADWLKAMRLPVTLLHRDVDRAEGGG